MEELTGPRAPEGKAKSSKNRYKGAEWEFLSLLARGFCGSRGRRCGRVTQ